MTDLKYEAVRPIAREELANWLASGDPQLVARALYSATKYEEDWSWVQDQCVASLSSPEVSIRWAAATCLGDLAFLRRPLNVDMVVSALETAIKDPEISDPASFSLSRVKQFVIPK